MTSNIVLTYLEKTIKKNKCENYPHHNILICIFLTTIVLFPLVYYNCRIYFALRILNKGSNFRLNNNILWSDQKKKKNLKNRLVVQVSERSHNLRTRDEFWWVQ